MQNEYMKKLFFDLFEVNIEKSDFRDFYFDKKFQKKVLKLKGKESYNLFKKILEIISCEDITHYKNLKFNLKNYRRVHVNNSYVIIFYDDISKKVYFVDYDHHDKIYKN